MREADPPSRRTALRRAAPGAGVALVAAALIAWVDRPSLAALLVVVGVVSLGLALVAPRWSTGLTRWLVRAGSWVGRSLILAVAALVGLFVMVPVWALNKVARLDPLDDGWQPLASNWRTRPSGLRPDGHPIGTVRMAGVEHLAGPGRRRGRIARAAIVLVVIAAVAASVVGLPRNRVQDGLPSELMAQAFVPDGELEYNGYPVTSYAHEDEPWIYDHVRDLLLIPHAWDPFLGVRLTDYDGRDVDVRGGRRVSYEPKDPELTVWYFGGSTMFGVGQRDAHTIPSEIARLAEADGISVRSENFGVSAWVNWQETMRLAELLDSEQPPDLIVFYDGVNERGAAFDRLQRGDVDPEHNWRPLTGELETAMRDRTFAARSGPVEDAKLVALAAAQYRRGVLWGRELAATAGVPIVYFWQPTLDGKVLGPSDAGALARVDVESPGLGKRLNTLGEQTLERSGIDAVDVSDAFDALDEPVYWDWAHTNELGARTVAAAMYEHLRPQVRQLASG